MKNVVARLQDGTEVSVKVESQSVRQTGLQMGDLYAAKRNTGWQLLTCESVHPKSFVIPQEYAAYCYDTWECFRVIE